VVATSRAVTARENTDLVAAGVGGYFRWEEFKF